VRSSALPAGIACREAGGGNRPRIAYATTYDALDVSHWSGTGYHIALALMAHGFDLKFIGPLPHPKALWPLFKAKGLAYNRFLHKGYFAEHDAAMARHYARVVEQQIQGNGRTDILFSPGTIPIAFVETDAPLAIWSDATHACLFDFYPEYSELSATTIRDGHLIEQAAIDRAAALIFSSDWAAESAMRDYRADPAKVHVVPYGANIEPPAPDEVERAIRARSRKVCKLLFIGVDWVRKGGDTALATARELNEAGLPTELTIVGCDPFQGETQPDFVRCEGFLDKQEETNRKRLVALLAESHFLVVPSRAECFGIVYCEANALGVPCLARSLGGIPTIVRDGVNGYLFDPAAPPSSYAQTIERLFRAYHEYLDLARAAANEYRLRLNWHVAGKRAREILVNVTQQR
jgi:glycosyltransferase involved in cell wall biosynthesis